MNSTTATVTDPVCSMTIDPAEAASSSSYNGRTYHFCSRGCQTKFDAAPEQYVSAAPAPAAAGSCCATEAPATMGGCACC